MLQNRVDPYGQLIKTKARGSWMGNRGLLHNEKQAIVRPYRLKAWITCRLEFKEWKRKVMSPNKYTELFFLDEATAFAAGHRPCFECRRIHYNAFKTFWLKGNPGYGFTENTSIREIDEILHFERDVKNRIIIPIEKLGSSMPDRVFISFHGNPYLIINNVAFQWSPFGYAEGTVLPNSADVTILTPASVVNAFRAGYRPQISGIGNEDHQKHCPDEV